MEDENFVYYKAQDGKIMAGGYEIKNELLRGGTPAIKSIKTQKGGSADTLAVPAGLFLLQQTVSSNSNKLPILEKSPQVIEESLYSRLLDLVKPTKPKGKRKSRKLRKRKNLRNTRRRS